MVLVSFTEDWNEYDRLRTMVQRTYDTAQKDYNNHLKDFLCNTSPQHSRFAAPKQSIFGIDSDIPPLSCSEGSICHSSNICEKAARFGLIGTMKYA